MTKHRRAFGYVRKLPSGRWQATYAAPDGVRRPGPTTFATKGDATAYLATVEADQVRGRWRAPEPARETFASYSATWMHQRHDLKASTRKLYEDLLRLWIVPQLGHMKLSELTPSTVRTWHATISKQTGKTRVAQAYRLLR